MPIKATLQWTEKVSPTAIRMRWRSDQTELPFIPGQFYRFRFQDDRGSFQRSYSFAQCDDSCAPGDFELLITPVVDGRATELLFGDSAQLEAEIEGPYGRLVYRLLGDNLSWLRPARDSRPIYLCSRPWSQSHLCLSIVFSFSSACVNLRNSCAGIG